MKKCRALVGFFNGSAQATAALLLIQTTLNVARALHVVADVATRWWSTWMMCQRLIFLRPYMNIMVTNNQLPATTMPSYRWTMVYCSRHCPSSRIFYGNTEATVRREIRHHIPSSLLNMEGITCYIFHFNM